MVPDMMPYHFCPLFPSFAGCVDQPGNSQKAHASTEARAKSIRHASMVINQDLS